MHDEHMRGPSNSSISIMNSVVVQANSLMAAPRGALRRHQTPLGFPRVCLLKYMFPDGLWQMCMRLVHRSAAVVNR